MSVNLPIVNCLIIFYRLFTCDKTTWVSYLDAFETAINVALRSVNYVDLPRLKLRNSGLDDAIVGLGSILAMKNMKMEGVWDSELFKRDEKNFNENEMTELLLVALRVLPKMAFYMTADKWRLEVLQNGGDNMVASWWNMRKEIQGVEGVANTETDFLGDTFITTNKPYLSKFLGTILQFQLLENYENRWELRNQSIAINIGNDENFL